MIVDFNKEEILALFKRARSPEEKRLAKRIREHLATLMNTVEVEQYRR